MSKEKRKEKETAKKEVSRHLRSGEREFRGDRMIGDLESSVGRELFLAFKNSWV